MVEVNSGLVTLLPDLSVDVVIILYQMKSMILILADSFQSETIPYPSLGT